MVAYPEGHTVWDSIVVDGIHNMTLQGSIHRAMSKCFMVYNCCHLAAAPGAHAHAELIEYFRETHHMTMNAWAIKAGKKGFSLWNAVGAVCMHRCIAFQF